MKCPSCASSGPRKSRGRRECRALDRTMARLQTKKQAAVATGTPKRSVGGSGPHDFAGRIDAARPAASTRPSHPAPNARDDRAAPLSWVRDAQTRTTDLPDGTRGFFATKEVTEPITLSRLPKSVFFARAIWCQCTRLCTLRTRSCIPLRSRRTIRNSLHKRIRSYHSLRCTGRQSEPAPAGAFQTMSVPGSTSPPTGPNRRLQCASWRHFPNAFRPREGHQFGRLFRNMT
jgi:hypothetical protein